MLKVARDMIRRMGFVGGLLLTLAFALPAFESHACAQEPSRPGVTAAAPAGQDAACPDCGPACANGCCHASHAATAPDSLVASGTAVFAAPTGWAHMTGRPLDSPGGPERPPRL